MNTYDLREQDFENREKFLQAVIEMNEKNIAFLEEDLAKACVKILTLEGKL